MDYAGFFRQLAEASARQSLPHFRADPGVENKQVGGFDPVTEADRQVEIAIRALIRAQFPGDGILGEEFGLENEASRRRWVIDPIDGTRAFISGIPVWGTLVGLLEGGEATAGMMAQPFTGELLHAARGGEAAYERGGERRPLTTRKNAELGDAILFTTSPHLQCGANEAPYKALESVVKLARYGIDCYAFGMLALGQVDLVCETGLQPYDIVGLIPLIEAAGGVVTCWNGGAAEGGGDVLASANPALHEKALRILQSRD